MEGMKGGGRVVGVSEDDGVGDGMQCINHPHRNNPGGICAFCLQEKLGKLVSSSFPLPITTASSSSPPPPSSSSPSFRSHTVLPTSSSSSSLSLSLPPTSHPHRDHHMRSRLPFLLAKKNKKKKPAINPSSSAAAATSSDVVFKRSKSTATPTRSQFLDDAEDRDFSPRKRNGFWSFLYPSSKVPSASCSKKLEAKSFRDSNSSPRISSVTVMKPRDKCLGSSLGKMSDMVLEEEEEEEEVEDEEEEEETSASASASLEQSKVSRSRSVGCGSRSFSGDFFERISTGFGDCTLRRVESQREGKPNKVVVAAAAAHGNINHCMKERVKCGGIFGGFMMMTTSSSSSSSSSYWVPSSADDGMNGNGELSHGKGRSWGWALASPMRAFTTTTKTTSSKDNNKRDASQKNPTPNLSAVPSLLTVRG